MQWPSCYYTTNICTHYLCKIIFIWYWSQQANKSPLWGFNFQLLTFWCKKTSESSPLARFTPVLTSVESVSLVERKGRGLKESWMLNWKFTNIFQLQKISLVTHVRSAGSGSRTDLLRILSRAFGSPSVWTLEFRLPRDGERLFPATLMAF